MIEYLRAAGLTGSQINLLFDVQVDKDQKQNFPDATTHQDHNNTTTNDSQSDSMQVEQPTQVSPAHG
jgi:hypothetical protein